MEIRANYCTRRAKSSRQAKKLEDSKILSEQATKTKNVIREIVKLKSLTDNKPKVVSNAKLAEKLTTKQKKVHKCSICSKVFKGERSIN